MIRGISKKIIEVNNTGSELFEKAIFYVKSDVVKSNKELQNEADRIILSYMSDTLNGYKIGYLRKNESYRKKKTIYIMSTILLAVVLFALMIILF